ncbi:MAG: 50S ribosomal protein L4 [Candidatus Pacebacteria bacterium]|nr:50S ribosomal protein L4 [Candidatus Paceibacterota bacterium]
MAPEKAQKNTPKTVVRKVAPKKAPAKAVKEKKVAAPVAAGSLSVPVYNISGKEVSTFTLPEALFGSAWNNNLVHQVAVSMQANARAGRGLAHTKDRGEVRGGGKKPWKQKGTGRARHGSSRSPLWVGGGITHGPRSDKNYEKQIPRKMRIAALRSVLSQKLRDGEILFIDSITFEKPMTATAKTILTTLAGVKGFERLNKKSNAALLAISSNDMNVKKSFRNFGNINVEEARNVNVVDALSSAYLIIENPDVTIPMFQAKLS